MVTNKVLGRPYPNVATHQMADGTLRYQAIFPTWDARTRRTSKSLGFYDTAREARSVVLIAQAKHLFEKAVDYCAEAARVYPEGNGAANVSKDSVDAARMPRLSAPLR